MTRDSEALKPRAAVAAMRPYHPPLEGRDGLRLDFNENTSGCSPRVIAALRSLTAEDLARYPEYGPAQADIAHHFGLDPARVLLTNGVDDAIFLALTTFADPGETVVIAEPTFAMYRFYAERAGLHIEALQYQDLPGASGQGREFYLDPAAISTALAQSPHPRVVIVANPNNPTGSVLPNRALLELAAAHPATLFFVDEAYADFTPDPAGLLAAVERQPNLVVARTFSKAHGLAAARLGILAAPPSPTPTGWPSIAAKPWPAGSACKPPSPPWASRGGAARPTLSCSRRKAARHGTAQRRNWSSSAVPAASWSATAAATLSAPFASPAARRPIPIGPSPCCRSTIALRKAAFRRARRPHRPQLAHPRQRRPGPVRRHNLMPLLRPPAPRLPDPRRRSPRQNPGRPAPLPCPWRSSTWMASSWTSAVPTAAPSPPPSRSSAAQGSSPWPMPKSKP
jgi:hypothetical protein